MKEKGSIRYYGKAGHPHLMSSGCNRFRSLLRRNCVKPGATGAHRCHQHVDTLFQSKGSVSYYVPVDRDVHRVRPGAERPRGKVIEVLAIGAVYAEVRSTVS